MKCRKSYLSDAKVLVGMAALMATSVNAALAPNQVADQGKVQNNVKQPDSRADKGRSGGGQQQSSPPQFKIGSIQDLCRIREREILFHASTALSQTTNALKESDPARKASLLEELDTTKQLAADVENSWQRLSCFTLLYGSPVLGGGR